ncbi:MAG TPA: S8 family serine peptidase, partial [Caldilinea sp.]|nr:S8 family serine peptidase [Caldilinea sp.]
RQDVVQVMLIEVEAAPASDVAIPTDRAPQVWARGYTGAGSRIAILERYNINATADACLDIVAARASTVDPVGHKSRVAAIAACNDPNNPTLRGMAYGAQIVDSGHDNTQPDIIGALTWATDPAFVNRAHVVNQSESIELDNILHFTDRAYDYWVKNRNFTAVIAAGNTSNNVTSPAKAYNVIAVGNVDDNNTVSWSDDVMRGTSSHVNPNTGVEKPEVAAPGTNINTVAGQDTGTSFAAPQVAGLAALLMQRDPDLRNWPTAVKAIIMASAVHNIEGDSHLSGQDGAGSIDAALADWVAQTEGNTGTCSEPCWWNIATTNAYPASGGNVERTFMANRGERIRVAISWLSYADPPTDTSLDLLYRNFDLQVIALNGETRRSESAVNNFEIIEFTAPATGQYTIRTVRNPAGDRGNEPGGNLLGIAWSKQATYLPDVRGNVDGWTSTFAVRNDGAEPRPVRVTYFYASGAYAGESNTALAPDQSWRLAAPSYLGLGVAIVDGAEDLSVAVLQEHSGPYTLDAYAGVATARQDIHIPIVQKGNSGWYSDLFVYNPNPQNATVTLTFKAAPNNGNDWSNTYVLGAGGMARFYTGYLPALGVKFVGSVRISSDSPDRPLAVAATQFYGASQLMELSSTQPLAAGLYGPLIQNNNSGWKSGVTLRAPWGNLPMYATYQVSGTGGGCAWETWWDNPQIVYPAPQGNPPGCGAAPNAFFSAVGR